MATSKIYQLPSSACLGGDGRSGSQSKSSLRFVMDKDEHHVKSKRHHRQVGKTAIKFRRSVTSAMASTVSVSSASPVGSRKRKPSSEQHQIPATEAPAAASGGASASPRALFSGTSRSTGIMSKGTASSCPSKICLSRSCASDCTAIAVNLDDEDALPVLTGTSLVTRIGAMTNQIKRCKVVQQHDNANAIAPTKSAHPSKQKDISSIKSAIPEGVTDIDAFPSCCQSVIKCTHQSNVNSSQSLSLSFFSTYGWEYRCTLRSRLKEEQDRHNGLSAFLPTREQPHLTDEMRTAVIDWMSRAAFQLHLQDSTLLAAAALLDNVIARRSYIEGRSMLDRIGSVCLLLAAKLNECSDEIDASPRKFLYVGPVIMNVEEFIEFEARVVDWLGYRLHQVTPLHFLDRFLHAGDPKNYHVRSEQLQQCGESNCRGPLECMVLYLLELASLRADLAARKPDLLAAAALYLARATFNLRSGTDENLAPQDMESDYWSNTLEYYTNYSVRELEDTVRVMHEMHFFASHEINPWHANEKFGGDKYCGVSMVHVLREEDLGFFTDRLSS